MPIDPNRLCKCHGEPMMLNESDGRRRCVIKQRERGRVRDRRFAATEKGRAWKRRSNMNARRIFIGERYVGCAAASEQAAQINAHARRRLSELKQRFSARAETESVPSSPVRAETEA